MKRINLNLFLISFCMLMLAGCSGGGDNSSVNSGERATSTDGYSVSGSAQKGPFLIGSTVNVTRLNSQGESTGNSLTTETIDSLGNFIFNMEGAGPVLITVTGYHYSELTGALSDDTLTLRAIYNVNDSSKQLANVNILTHLTHGRVLELIKTGIPISEAISSAENEWLEAIAEVVPYEDAAIFSQLNLYDMEDESSLSGNDYLLLMSAIFYQNATNLAAASGGNIEAKLAELLNTTADNFKADGKIADQNLINQLMAASTQINVEQINENLKNRGRDISGIEMSVPNISKLLPQVLIVSPADGAIVTQQTKIKFAISQDLKDPIYSLFVDGELIQQITDAPYEFDWNPYFWSLDVNNRHTLLIEAKEGNVAHYSNLVNVALDGSFNNEPKLSFPVNDQIIRNSKSPTLTWENLSGATNYQVQLFLQNNRINPVYSTITDSNQVTISELAKESYVWRIRGMNDQGRVGIWSSFAGFSINGPLPPLGESLVANVSKYNDTSYSVDLSWAAVAGASQYIIEISSDEVFDTSVKRFQGEAATTSYATQKGFYYWRVAAINDNAIIGDWSDIQVLEAGVFQRQFGGSDNDYAKQVITTMDGGSIILAVTHSKGDAEGDDWLIKLDSNGNSEWDFVVEKSGYSRLSEILEMDDGSIYGVGNTNHTDQKGYLIKLSGEKVAENRIIWEREYRVDDAFREIFNSFTAVDNRLYVVGRQCRSDSSCSFPLNQLYEVDLSDGARISSIEIPNTTGGEITGLGSLTATNQGDLLLACTTNYRACLINMNVAGNLNWNRITAATWFGFGGVAAEAPWGEILLTGWAIMPSEIPLAVYDLDGIELDIHVDFGGAANKRELVFDNDGNLLRLFVGDASNKAEIWSTNRNGVTRVVKVYEALESVNPRSMVLDVEGNAIAVFNKSTDDSGNDILIVKTTINSGM